MRVQQSVGILAVASLADSAAVVATVAGATATVTDLGPLSTTALNLFIEKTRISKGWSV